MRAVSFRIIESNYRWQAQGNIISGNGTYGIYSSDAGPFPAVIENTISNNGSYPIRVGAMMNVKDNICSGNGIQAIEILPETISADTSWRNNGVPYVVTGDITVRHSQFSSSHPTATLTIDPGVEIRFEPGTGLYIGYKAGYVSTSVLRGPFRPRNRVGTHHLYFQCPYLRPRVTGRGSIFEIKPMMG